MRPCSHPGSSAYGNTSLSITVTDGTWVTVGPQDNMQTPMETWDYGSESGSRSVVSDSLQPHGLYSPWNSQGQNTGVGNFLFPSPEDLPNPGIEPRFPAMQADSLPSEPPGNGVKALLSK